MQRHLAEHEVVVCGMALGYADPEAPENTLVTEREPASGFMAFLGFEACEPAATDDARFSP